MEQLDYNLLLVRATEYGRRDLGWDGVHGRAQPGHGDCHRCGAEFGEFRAVRSDHVDNDGLSSPEVFSGFFPDLFFPAKARIALTRLRPAMQDYAGLRWINCCRPWDQIGTRLSLPVGIVA